MSFLKEKRANTAKVFNFDDGGAGSVSSVEQRPMKKTSTMPANLDHFTGAVPSSPASANAVPGTGSGSVALSPVAGGVAGRLMAAFGIGTSEPGNAANLATGAALRLGELEETLKSQEETLKSTVDHLNSLHDIVAGNTTANNQMLGALESLSLRCCPAGHRLRSIGTTRDDGWCCDNAQAEEGCKSSITDEGQTFGMNRFRCETCDYDLCMPCHALAAHSDVGVWTIEGDILMQVKADLEIVIHRIEDVKGHAEHVEEGLVALRDTGARVERLEKEKPETHSQLRDLTARLEHIEKRCAILHDYEARLGHMEKTVASVHDMEARLGHIERSTSQLREHDSRLGSLETQGLASPTLERAQALVRELESKLQQMDAEANRTRENEARFELGLKQKACTADMKSLGVRLERLEGSTQMRDLEARVEHVECRAAAIPEFEARVGHMEHATTLTSTQMREALARLERLDGSVPPALEKAAGLAGKLAERLDRVEAQGPEIRSLDERLRRIEVEGAGPPPEMRRSASTRALEARIERLEMSPALPSFDQGTSYMLNLEVRIDRLEKEGSALVASMRKEAATASQLYQARLESTLEQRHRQTADNLEQLGMRVEVLEIHRQSDAVTKQQTDLFDLDKGKRDRRITERLDLQASYIGASVQQMEKRFRELRSDMRAAGRPQSAALAPIGTLQLADKPASAAAEALSPPLALVSTGAGANSSLRVEWDISGKTISTHRTSVSFDSPEFSCGPVDGLRLRFHPKWTDRVCLAAVVAPRDLGLACRLIVDGLAKDGTQMRLSASGAPDDCVYYAAEFPAKDGCYGRVSVELAPLAREVVLLRLG